MKPSIFEISTMLHCLRVAGCFCALYFKLAQPIFIEFEVLRTFSIANFCISYYSPNTCFTNLILLTDLKNAVLIYLLILVSPFGENETG